MPLSHTISALPLRPSSLLRLEQRGFVTTAEIDSSKENGGIANLASELSVSLVEAASIVREVESAIKSVTGSEAHPFRKTTTALSILKRTKTTERTVVTFSKALDGLLGGGFSKSEVTEVVGLPGAGKTQLAMQLCVDARLPTSFGGVAGESVYIDTEGSFSPERCYTMAKALVEHVQRSSQNRRAKSPQISIPDLPSWFQAENILDGIHVYRVHDEAAQAATIYSLPKFLKQRTEKGTPVRLVIVDSIAFHYRCAPPGYDYMARTRSLTNIAAFLSDLAATFDLAVVVINQMTTKIILLYESAHWSNLHTKLLEWQCTTFARQGSETF